MILENEIKLGIIGLGYVGLPLAVEFGRKYETIGFDLNVGRILELQSGTDSTLEVTDAELQSPNNLSFTSHHEDISDCNVYIVAVPTPIDEFKRPNLRPLEGASTTVGKWLKPGDVVIFESTVYPGATEEVCVPLLEQQSGLKYNVDFFCGYSPERINPGDKEHRLPSIVKVTSGSTPEYAQFIDTLYSSIITAGTFCASSIKVAEAAKVIENTQRDLNIALINELAVIFNKLNIDTEEVLKAAGTKWNFLPFRPGLVGGHCIGVDPYYLTHKAKTLGYHAKIINSGRYVNDSMGFYVAKQCVKRILSKGKSIIDSRILIMGAAFKEDVSDIRNSKVIDVIKEFESFSCEVEIVDPHADSEEFMEEYGYELAKEATGKYDAVVLAVNHEEYTKLNEDYFKSILTDIGEFVDIKGVYKNQFKDLSYWSL